MTHDAGFHGNQLRLTAILQIAGRIPKAPTRLRPHRQAPLSLQHLQGGSITCHQLATSLEPSGKSPSKDHRKASDENVQEFDLPVQSSENPLSCLSRKNSEKNAMTNPDMHGRNICSETNPLSNYTPFQSPVKRKKVVHFAEEIMLNAPTQLLQSRRKHHSSSDNGLVLVRTSTDVGLPLPVVRICSQDSRIDEEPEKTNPTNLGRRNSFREFDRKGRSH
jgi:hypothetical protein